MISVSITKYGHSCVLVEYSIAESSGSVRTYLFDPGAWSSLDGVTFNNLNAILVSHEHGDHWDEHVLRSLTSAHPDVPIISTPKLVSELQREGFRYASSKVPVGLQAFTAPHEVVTPFGAVTPEQLGVHVLDVYTHPGDSHSFTETMPVVGIAVSAPWGSVRRALELILDLKPQYVLPLHDWFLSDDARKWTFNVLAEKCAEAGITFLQPNVGEPIQIKLS